MSQQPSRNTDTFSSNTLMGLCRLHLGEEPSGGEPAPPHNQTVTYGAGRAESISFSRRANGSVQCGTEIISSNHPSIPTPSQHKTYLPRSVEIPVTFQHAYPDDLNPVVIVWVHSLRYDATGGCDFNVSASGITYSGFSLDCHVSQMLEFPVLEIGVTWLAYLPLRRDIHSGHINIPSMSLPDQNVCGTVTLPRHLATGHGVDVFLALTCVLAKGQNVGVSIALDGLSDSNSRDWLFTFSGTGADRCLHAAKAVYIILR